MKFGDALVQAGALSREQLSKALEMQKILGGRLGTNLLELGYVDERTLLDELGRFRSTQVVTPADLEKIGGPVLRSIPAKLALRYRLVPYQVRGKTLFVASKDPGDALQEDEISFLTSFMVRTHVTLELHLEVALRRHFKAPLDQRYVALFRRAKAAARSGVPSSAPPSPVPSSSIPPASPSAPVPSPSPAPSPSESAPSPAPSTTPPSVEAEPAPAAETESDPSLQPGLPEPEFIELDASDLASLRRPGTGLMPAIDPETLEPSFEPKGDVPTEPPSAEPPSADEPPVEESAEDPALDSTGVDLDDSPLSMPAASEPPPDDADVESRLLWAAQELQAADIRDEIGDVLLAFAGAYYRRRALVIRRKEELVGWMASGELDDAASIRELSLEGTAPSVFFGLQSAGSFWLGPLPPLPANRALVQALGGVDPRDCLVLPISLRSKIVGYLYVDNLDAGVAGTPVAEMKRLMAKAGLAFEVYILKNKIRMA